MQKQLNYKGQSAIITVVTTTERRPGGVTRNAITVQGTGPSRNYKAVYVSIGAIKEDDLMRAEGEFQKWAESPTEVRNPNRALLESLGYMDTIAVTPSVVVCGNCGGLVEANGPHVCKNKTVSEPCASCEGKGTVEGEHCDEVEPCMTCGGSGKFTYSYPAGIMPHPKRVNTIRHKGKQILNYDDLTHNLGPLRAEQILSAWVGGYLFAEDEGRSFDKALKV